LSRLRKAQAELCHQTAIAITLFEEPLATERLPTNPIQKVSVNVRANRFHQVASETIARVGFHVKKTDTRIEPKSDGGQAGF
jgi:hypothetical protein